MGKILIAIIYLLPNNAHVIDFQVVTAKQMHTIKHLVAIPFLPYQVVKRRVANMTRY